MKKLKSLLLAFLCFNICLGGFAAARDKGPNFSQLIRSAFNNTKNLKLKNNTETITVCFVVNEQGDVTEANARTNNKELKAQLENRFLSLNLKGLSPCVTNTVDLKFTNY